MSVIVTFACGHLGAVQNTGGAPPVCEACGEGRVRHVTAPPPRFRGVATGPYAVVEQLPARPVSLRESEKGS